MLPCLVVLALAACTTHAYSNGSMVATKHSIMDSACISGNLRPHHGINNNKPADKPLQFPIQGQGPFRLTTNKQVYGPGEIINVAISTRGNQRFKGFFITVDMEDAMMGMGKGKFEPIDNKATPAKYCVEGIIHTGPGLKPTVTVKYRAPAQFTHGTLQFKATVVAERTKFYTGILSAPVKPKPNTLTETQYNQRNFQSSGGMSAMFKNLAAAGGAGGNPMGGGAMDTFLSNVMSNMRQMGGSAQGGGGMGAGGPLGGGRGPMNFNMGGFGQG